MRRLVVAVVLALAFAPAAARAEEQAGATCTASSTDEECAAYWEHHINWLSLDYRQGPKQLPEHRHMPPPFGFALFNFAVFVAILYRLAGKPLRDFVRARHLALKRDLEGAAALKRDAADKLRLCQARLDGIEDEMAALVETVRREAAAEKDRLIASAGDEAARLKRDVELRIASELAALRSALRREVVEAALASAESLLREQMRPQDRTLLAEKSVAGMETLAPEHGARPRP